MGFAVASGIGCAMAFEIAVCAEPTRLKKRPWMGTCGQRLMLLAVAAFCGFAEPALVRGQYGAPEQELVSISVEPRGRSARFRVLFRFEPSDEPYWKRFWLHTSPRGVRATHLGGLHVDHDIADHGIVRVRRGRFRSVVEIGFFVEGVPDEGAGPDARTVVLEFIADIDVSFGFGTTSFYVPDIRCHGERCVHEISYEASGGECLGDFVAEGERCVRRSDHVFYATIVRRSWTHIWALLGLTLVLCLGMLMIQRKRRRELLVLYPVIPEETVVSTPQSHGYRTPPVQREVVRLDAELHSDVERWLGKTVRRSLWLLPIPWFAVWYAPPWIPSVVVGGIAAAFVLISVWRRTRCFAEAAPGMLRVWVVALVSLGAMTVGPLVIDYAEKRTADALFYGLCIGPMLVFSAGVIFLALSRTPSPNSDSSRGSAARRQRHSHRDQWDDFDPPDFDD